MGYSVADKIYDVFASDSEAVMFNADEGTWECDEDYPLDEEFFNTDDGVTAQTTAAQIIDFDKSWPREKGNIGYYWVFPDGWFHWSDYQAIAHYHGERTTTP